MLNIRHDHAVCSQSSFSSSDPISAARMALGEIQVVPFEGGENIAQYVAFAASVDGDMSSGFAIQQVAEALGSETHRLPTVRLVSAPLLGTGAGGLREDLVAAALSAGFKSVAHRDARLVIHVLNEEVFRRLSNAMATPRAERPKRKAPRVFVSYCHSTPEQEGWIAEFGTFLRDNGVDARLDLWHLRRGMDLPQFMTNELTLADRVILVSDEKYAEKADSRVGGVGWETMLVQGDMAQQSPESTKYLVVVRTGELQQGLPRYLKTRFVIHWPGVVADSPNRETILRELYDQIEVPPLGPQPVFV